MGKETAAAKTEALYALSRPSRCHGCDTKLNVDEIVRLNKKDNDEKEAFCLKCAGLLGMELLRSGNAAVTRLAKKIFDQPLCGDEVVGDLENIRAPRSAG